MAGTLKTFDIFYDIENDLKKAPEAAIFIILGGRGTGKTYSTLKFCYTCGKKFVFIKRTNKDVNLLCSGGKGDSNLHMDLSPFKSINHDIGSNVQAYKMFDGMGGFWDTENGEPIGSPIGYILSLNAVAKYKGFDLSDCDYIIFDEFIPLLYERINRNEGLELMDLYRTVGRANHIKYGTVLKLICLANATTVSCPVLSELELTDDLVDMQVKKESERYLQERGIFIRIIDDINGFREEEAKNPIYKAMAGTKWARMSLDNEFAYNDFSNVGKISVKNMICLARVTHKNKTFYIYCGDNGYYLSYKKSNRPHDIYDLNLDNGYKKFYIDYVIDLARDCIEGRVKFDTFEMYDLIVNYKEFYKI